MEPIKQLVYGLRRYDLARVTALADGVPDAEIKGFMSHKAKVYLVRVWTFSSLVIQCRLISRQT